MKTFIIGILFIIVGAFIAFVFVSLNKSVGTDNTVTTNTLATIAKTKFSMSSAPSESLRGIVNDIKGQVRWQSRTATTSANLVDTILIQQGENISTGQDGQLNIQFASSSAMMLSANTEVEVIQTLPTSMVFRQSKGSARYSALAKTPVSVRILNALVNIKSGVVTIEIDGETGLVMLSQESGASTIAYNSPDYVTKVWDIDAPEKFEYDSNEQRGYYR